MNNLAIFQFIFDQIETPFLQSVTTLVQALQAYAATPMRTALVLYVALAGIMMMRGRSAEPAGDTIGRMIKLALVAWFATSAGAYASWVQDFFLTVLPRDITAAVSAAGTGTQPVSANSFDAIWKQAYQAGLQVWGKLDYWDVGEEIVIVVFWAAALIACVAGFATWFLSHVILGLFIIVGPLMIGLALFPATRSIFERWIGSMVSCVVLQVAVTVLITLTIAVEAKFVGRIAAYRGPNQFEQLYALFAGVIFFVFAVVIILQLPGFATALAGGLHFHTGTLARAAFSVTRRAGRQGGPANPVFQPAAPAQGSPARPGIRPQTGASLSSSPR